MINSVKKRFGPHFTLDKGLREFGWDSVCATPRVTHETCHLIYSAKLPRPRLSNAKRIKESASTLFFFSYILFSSLFSSYSHTLSLSFYPPRSFFFSVACFAVKMDGNNLALIRQEFLLSPDKFKAIVEGFKAECEHGLATASASGLATMIPSYVTRMPTGNETGTYLALDLGGSTLRVSAVQLLGNGQVKVTEVRRLITGTLRSGTTDAFFDWVVDAIAELIETIPPRDDEQHQKQPLAMGVSWSFPLE